MNKDKKYYEAYEERYKQVHDKSLQWFSQNHSHIVKDVVSEFHIQPTMKILEIGCGEGRDAIYLLKQGYDILATDISAEAISYCQKKYSEVAQHFQILNCIQDSLEIRFDFIYAVAVIHMFVLQEDRDAFYQFIGNHLSSLGIALICSMGDGEFEKETDIHKAFDIQERTHEETKKKFLLTSTSCKIVNFHNFLKEIEQNHLMVLKYGLTSIEPDFPKIMYAVVRKA